MEASEVLRGLETQGTDQNRKIYRRHGADGEIFGVSYANLKLWKQRLKVDQVLAEALWESGIHDARVLAKMIADPKSMGDATLDTWANQLSNPVLSDAVAGVAAHSPNAAQLMNRWINSENEWICSSGWSALARLAGKCPELTVPVLEGWLARIEETIHVSPNRVRHCMNGALIAIGLVDEEFCQKATIAARKIGRVVVDHGETSCKTPDAVAYIAKAMARKG